MIFLNFMLSNNLKIAGMKIIKIERNNRVCAVVESDETVIADVQSALELLMNVSFDIGTKSIAIIIGKTICTQTKNEMCIFS